MYIASDVSIFLRQGDVENPDLLHYYVSLSKCMLALFMAITSGRDWQLLGLTVVRFCVRVSWGCVVGLCFSRDAETLCPSAI